MTAPRSLNWIKTHPLVCNNCHEYYPSKRSLEIHQEKMKKKKCQNFPSTKGPKESFINEMFNGFEEAEEYMLTVAPDDSFCHRANLRRRLCKIKNCSAEVRVRKTHRLCIVDEQQVPIIGYSCIGTTYHDAKLHKNKPTKKKGFCNETHVDHKIIFETFESHTAALSKMTSLLPKTSKVTVKKRSAEYYHCSCHPKCRACLRVISKNPEIIVLKGCIRHFRQ